MSPSPGEIVWASTKEISAFEHVVFIGAYNADRFLPSIANWLPRLRLGSAALVVADNASSDSTCESLRPLLEQLAAPTALVRNERNFGGYGNLAVNLPLLNNAKWITTLHQDDVYSADHVSRHQKALKGAPKSLGMIASEARSVNENGETLAFPRAGWLLKAQEEPVTLFLTHLKHHAFPFSGATFAKQVLLNFPIPWHSSAFPDTEIVLKMCPEFEMVFAEGVTVQYLENSASESHSLSQEQREFGAFQSLLRVFGHKNFGLICHAVPTNLQEEFIRELVRGIEVRFQDKTLRTLMTQFSLEVAGQHLGIFPGLASEIAKGYESVADTRATEILASLGATPITKTSVVGDSRNRSQLGSSAKNTKTAALRLFGLLPTGIRSVVFRQAMRIPLVKGKLSAWDFDWKNN